MSDYIFLSDMLKILQNSDKFDLLNDNIVLKEIFDYIKYKPSNPPYLSSLICNKINKLMTKFYEKQKQVNYYNKSTINRKNKNCNNIQEICMNANPLKKLIYLERD